MAEPVRRSPLAPLHDALAGASGNAVTLREIPFRAQINLRGDAGDAGFRDAVASVVGVAPPQRPNTVVSTGARGVLWLGPDEWLIVGADGEQAALEADLCTALEGRHASIVDVSANRTIIETGGARIRAVLAKGCSLDLHPRAFTAGRCAQTLVAHAQIILQQTADAPTYRLYVRCSFARHLAAWLLDASAEYANAAASVQGHHESTGGVEV